MTERSIVIKSRSSFGRDRIPISYVWGLFEVVGPLGARRVWLCSVVSNEKVSTGARLEIEQREQQGGSRLGKKQAVRMKLRRIRGGQPYIITACASKCVGDAVMFGEYSPYLYTIPEGHLPSPPRPYK